jgi:SAM-dependent methyltransferase
MSFFPRDVAAPGAQAGPVVEWEEVDCLLCGGRNWSPLLEAPDAIPGGTGLWFAVVQCQDCGLCFTNPRPSPNTIGRFYPEVYPPHRAPRSRRAPGWRRLTRWCRKPRRERRALALFGRGRLLDFGCGGGAFLGRMQRRGWQCTGLDTSAAAVRRVRSELGLHVLQGTLPHPDLRPASFDLLTMWHALEHVHRPLAILREARRLLVPGGKLVVAVPNIDSLPFRWFGQAWFGLDLPRHLTHFAPWTLYLILHRAGFRVGPVRMVRHSGWLRASARNACQRPQASRWHRWLVRKTPSRLATWYSYLTGQADCMLVTAER